MWGYTWVTWGWLVVNFLLYADVTVLLRSTPSELQTLNTVMKDDCMYKGLQMNNKKMFSIERVKLINMKGEICLTNNSPTYIL